MDINSAFPGRFLKAADLKGTTQTFTVESVGFEKVGDDGNKPVMRFTETEQGFVLNKTNSQLLTEELGSPDTGDWIGEQIVLYPTKVQFGMKMVAAIRVQTVNDLADSSSAA